MDAIQRKRGDADCNFLFIRLLFWNRYSFALWFFFATESKSIYHHK